MDPITITFLVVAGLGGVGYAGYSLRQRAIAQQEEEARIVRERYQEELERTRRADIARQERYNEEQRIKKMEREARDREMIAALKPIPLRSVVEKVTLPTKPVKEIKAAISPKSKPIVAPIAVAASATAVTAAAALAASRARDEELARQRKRDEEQRRKKRQEEEEEAAEEDRRRRRREDDDRSSLSSFSSFSSFSSSDSSSSSSSFDSGGGSSGGGGASGDW